MGNLLTAISQAFSGRKSLSDVIKTYEDEVIPRGNEEVTCSVENGYMLHDWNKIETSPVFTRGFKPMEGHGEEEAEPNEKEQVPQVTASTA